MRLAAGCVALVGSARGVGGDHRDVSERHAKFFGDELRLRSDDALAKLLLAGVAGHFAVRRDGNPRVHLVGSRRTARFANAELRENRIEVRHSSKTTEADGERTGRFQKTAAGKRGTVEGLAGVARH